MSDVVLVTIFAVGNFDHLSIANKMYASLFNSSGRGPLKSNGTSSLVSITGSIRNECFFPMMGFKFLPCSVQCLHFVPFAQLTDENVGTRHVDTNPTWLPIPDVSNVGCLAQSV